MRVAPVGKATFGDFETLFTARGAPHYCWCRPYRFRDGQHLSKEERHAGMRRLVQAGTPIGLVAYDGDAPIGWCSAAPRESYVKLERSRTMPRVSDAPTWTVLCFFVQRAYRHQGVPAALLAGAVREARRRGAKVLEGYPHDTAGVSSTHLGTSKLYRALGFRREGRRWSLELG